MLRRMTRFMSLACVVLITIAWFAGALHAAMPARDARPPNILLLVTDDQRADALSCAGHPVIQTPNLDALAAQGVRFTRAFAVDPTCMPSRATFFLGQCERAHGLGFSSPNKMSIAQWQSSYPALLRGAGYHTGFIGKFGIDKFDFKPEEQFDYWCGHHGWAKFYPKPQENSRIYQRAKADTNTEIMGELAVEFLRTRPRDKPFCLSVSFSAPHGSVTISMEDREGKVGRDTAFNKPAVVPGMPWYTSLYREPGPTLPRTFTIDPATFLPSNVYAARSNVTYSYDYDAKRCREHLVRYEQCVHGVDRIVGDIRASLEATGAANNTVILFTSDNGLLIGDYGMGGKSLMYDLSARVPMIVYDPRMPATQRGRENGELVSNLDVAPTILHLAGIDPPAQMQGSDLMTSPPRDELYLENLFVGQGYPIGQAVRTQRWKYARYRQVGQDEKYPYDARADTTWYEQLFDLRDDPGEIRNEADREEHAALLKHLRGRCEQLSREARGEPQL